jgi:hypothetical protein
VSRRLFPALLAPMLAVIWLAASFTPAHAYYGVPYHGCVVVNSSTWLRTCYDCRWERVYKGRAFRVERQRGEYLQVWNLESEGWVRFWALSPAPHSYCRAAGI